MRISGEQSQLAGSVAPVTGANPTAAKATDQTAAASGVESPAATVTLSANAQAIQQAKAAVAATPDVREGLVASIKAKVDAGTYNVSSSDIADMMLRRHTADHSA